MWVGWIRLLEYFLFRGFGKNRNPNYALMCMKLLILGEFGNNFWIIHRAVYILRYVSEGLLLTEFRHIINLKDLLFI